MKFFSFINEARKRLLREKIAREVKRLKPKKILDNGCGEYGSFDYNEFESKITKADILYGINCEKLPYKSHSFDCVIFAGVIQYTNNPQKAIKECYRVLKKNGTLIISTINKDSLIKKIWGFKDEKQVYTLDQFVRFLEKFKFRVINKEMIDFWFIPKRYKMILYGSFTKI